MKITYIPLGELWMKCRAEIGIYLTLGPDLDNTSVGKWRR